MLVLARKIGESLMIDELTELRVLDIRGGRVRLGITAPGDVAIRRSELTAIPSSEVGRVNARSAGFLGGK